MANNLTRAEAWALNIIDRVHSGGQVEDSRVELKRDWPEEHKAARRIAGQANSSFGAEFLWLIGVDEETGAYGAKKKELANWWRNVESKFEGPAPSFVDFALSVRGKTIICLLFQSGRPPYVVANPKYGEKNGGPIALEVPWREGTGVRTARRNDLVRMLVPVAVNPEIEVLSASGRLEEYLGKDGQKKALLRLEINAYLVPRSESRVVIPFHRCRCVFFDMESNSLEEFEVEMTVPIAGSIRNRSFDTATMTRTSSELLAEGPGRCSIVARKTLFDLPEWLLNATAVVRLDISVVDSDLPVEIVLNATPIEPGPRVSAQWSLSVSR